MERFTAEALKAERDRAVQSAIKAKMPIFEIARDFGLTEAEIGALIVEQNGPQKRPDDLLDATEDPRLIVGRR